MRLDRAIEDYVENLHESGYSIGELRRKRSLLCRRLAYALALCRPATVELCADRPLRLYSHGGVSDRMEAYRRRAAEHFVIEFCRKRQEGVSYLTLGAYLQDYRERYLGDDPGGRGGRAIEDLCRALGLEADLAMIDRGSYDRVVEYLEAAGIDRAAGYSVAFFGFCRRQGWIGFDPPSRVRGAHERVFDPDFLGTEDRLWTGRLRLYLKYLREQKNLSEGGIDYYARKLKMLVRWLDDQELGRVDAATVRKFLSEREKRGVKALTRAKYVYSARYFFDFLLSEGLYDSNPARRLCESRPIRLPSSRS